MGSIFPIDVNGKNTSLVWRFGRTLTGGSSPSAPEENRLWPCPRCVSLPLKCLSDLNKRAMSRLWKEKAAPTTPGSRSRTRKHFKDKEAHEQPARTCASVAYKACVARAKTPVRASTRTLTWTPCGHLFPTGQVFGFRRPGLFVAILRESRL